MIRSLYSGISGLRNHQLKMDVIGNNIANINTIGFKGQRVTFADQISQLLRSARSSSANHGSTNALSVGLGVSTQSIDTDHSQGVFESTGFTTDLAINGNGFFVIRNGSDSMYTRAGNFTIDAEGNLITGNGDYVQGWNADANGIIGTENPLGDLQIPLQMKIAPKATDEVVFYSNLDMTATSSLASLDNAGDSGVTSVNGTANDGIGGTHSIAITGSQATNSTNTGSLATMNLSDTLSSLNVTSLDGFSVTVDQGTGDEVTYEIAGLSTSSTVSDLINALNEQSTGATFELVSGAIVASRDYAGDGANYNVQLNDGAAGSNLVTTIFAAGGVFNANNGTDSSLEAIDTFTDSTTGTITTTLLELVADSQTGLMTEMRGVGGDGVSIQAADGLAATTTNPLLITTADTDHTTSIMVYDSQGETHNLSMTFIKTAVENQWAWKADASSPATVIDGDTGLVTFNEDGSLATFTFDDNVSAFSFNTGNGAEEMVVSFDPGSFNTFNGITQTSSPFTTSAIRQSGYGLGDLDSIQIDTNGTVNGVFTNGVEQTLAQFVIADFNNANGLDSAGGNMWRSTASSGEPIFGQSEVNFNSQIQAGYLELSNVDLVREFTDMITTQRGFQANARVITTSDQILTEITQLKR